MNKKLKSALLAGQILAGGAMIKNQIDKGNLTGRELTYHGTDKKNVRSIKENGIMASRASDKDNLTHKALSEYISDDDMKGLTYVGRKKYPATGVSIVSAVYDSNNRASRNYKNLKRALRNRETLKVKIPAWKMDVTDNPELMGTKNSKEFYPIVKKRLSTPIGASSKDVKLKKDTIADKIGYGAASKVMYNSLGREGTHTIRGDISPEYIKGSKKYKRADKEEVKEFIKNNPGRFAKGVAGATTGALIIGNGLKMIKGASSYYEEIEKQAMSKKNVAKAIAGATLLASTPDLVLGKKKLYQGTTKGNWESIKKEGLKADRGGKGGAGENVGNSAFQNNSKGKVHLTAVKPIANMYSTVNTYPILVKRKELSDLKNKAMNINVESDGPGKNKVEYKLKRGYHKPNIEKVQKMEKELYDMNLAQRTPANILLGPSRDSMGKTIKVNLDYNKWKKMEQDREGTPLKKYTRKLKGDNNPLIKHMAARGEFDVSKEEIKDSDATIKDRAKHTVKALPEYIKENPLRFGTGVAGSAIGAKLLKDVIRRG